MLDELLLDRLGGRPILKYTTIERRTKERGRVGFIGPRKVALLGDENEVCSTRGCWASGVRKMLGKLLGEAKLILLNKYPWCIRPIRVCP